MRASRVIRTAIATAAVVVLAVVWLLFSSAKQTEDANQWVRHTQEVLAQVEATLETLTTADSAVRQLLAEVVVRQPDALDRAGGSIDAELDRLVILTADNPAQQSRIQQFRTDASQVLALLHRSADAKRRGVSTADDLDLARSALDAVRRTAQEIRGQEIGLLGARTDSDHAAVRRLQETAGAILVIAIVILGGFLALLTRTFQRQERSADQLGQAKTDLEKLVADRTSALRESAARLQSIIDSTVDGIIVIDASGHIEAFNRGAERLFGYAATEAIGQNVNMLMPSPHDSEHDGYLSRYLEGGAAKIIGIGREVRGRRRDGTTFPLHLSVGEMFGGTERKFTGMLHDLSKRAELDERLRSSEARWRSIVQSAVDGIVIIDVHGRIQGLNGAAERLFGYAETDVIGRNVNILMPAPYHGEHDTYLARYLATGVKKIIGTGREVTGLRRDGTTFPLHLSVGEFAVDGERMFTGIVHDLSARVQMEERLRDQAAMAHLGEIAAMIAHEVKNPLAGIRGAIQVIGGRLPSNSRDAAVAIEVVKRIDSLNDLMKDLLLFARPPQLKPGVVSVSELVSSTASLLTADPSATNVRVHIDGAAPPIVADAELLKIVFVNLLINGAHAMDGHGVISVTIATVDGVCRIGFRDTGPGIPADIREKIFTPFFTTKSKGSGLGLPTVKRLIEAHAGRIEIECPRDGGTVVTVALPAEQPAIA
jgi:two-component system, LuxR family, sensor kinase FixL